MHSARESWLVLCLLVACAWLPAQANFDAEWLAREWEVVTTSLAPPQRSQLAATPPAARPQLVQQWLAEHRRRADAAFVATLPPAEQAAYAAAPLAQQPVLLLELRVAHKFEQVLEDALQLGVLDEAGVAAARAIEEPTARGQRILALQKAMFLVVHRELLERLPPGLYANLQALPPVAFFQHGIVRGVRMRGQFTDQGLAALRFGGRPAIEAFAVAVVDGTWSAEQLAMLREEPRARLLRMPPEERLQFAAALRRNFFREVRRPARPARGADSPFVLPRELFVQLTVEEQDAFLRLDAEARRAFARQRFPNREVPSPPSTRVQLTTGEFLDGWAKLGDTERAQFLAEPLQRAVQAIVAGRRAAAAVETSDLAAWLGRLSAAERAEYEQLPERERHAWLRQRFPELR